MPDDASAAVTRWQVISMPAMLLWWRRTRIITDAPTTVQESWNLLGKFTVRPCLARNMATKLGPLRINLKKAICFWQWRNIRISTDLQSGNSGHQTCQWKILIHRWLFHENGLLRGISSCHTWGMCNARSKIRGWVTSSQTDEIALDGQTYYPLVMTNISIENHHFFMGKSTIKSTIN